MPGLKIVSNFMLLQNQLQKMLHRIIVSLNIHLVFACKLANLTKINLDLDSEVSTPMMIIIFTKYPYQMSYQLDG